MKKKIFISSILTCIFIFTPTSTLNIENKINKNINMNLNCKDKFEKEKIEEKDESENMAVFSSKTCYKKTYYIKDKRVDVYEDNTGKDKAIFSLYKDDVIVVYKEENGYLYCEENKIGRKGWIKNKFDDLKAGVDKSSNFKIDVSLTGQFINVYNKGNIIKDIKCSTGIVGDQNTETPLGIFSVQSKGKYFYSNKYEQGGRYYIKFFANYLIHSIPVDKKGNIIEEEKNKLGFPSSHGCIRISMEDAEWMYNNIPKDSIVYIHY